MVNGLRDFNGRKETGSGELSRTNFLCSGRKEGERGGGKNFSLGGNVVKPDMWELTLENERSTLDKKSPLEILQFQKKEHSGKFFLILWGYVHSYRGG